MYALSQAPKVGVVVVAALVALADPGRLTPTTVAILTNSVVSVDRNSMTLTRFSEHSSEAETHSGVARLMMKTERVWVAGVDSG